MRSKKKKILSDSGKRLKSLAKPKKIKLRTIKSLKAELWKLCREITRKRYIKQDGSWDCYTCGKRIDEPRKNNTGHCIPRRFCGFYLDYDLRNLRCQCPFCNRSLGGNGAVYIMKLIDEIGAHEVDDMINYALPRKESVPNTQGQREYYQNLIDEYKKL